MDVSSYYDNAASDNAASTEAAQRLLERILPPEEFALAKMEGCLYVRKDYGFYRIQPTGRVHFAAAGAHGFCAEMCLVSWLPVPALDNAIANYILIKNDDRRFWRTAQQVWRHDLPYDLYMRFLAL